MENRNLILDYYQLTMGDSYYTNNRKNDIVYFDMFYRKNPDKGGYVISAGLDEVIDYIENLSFSDSDIEFLKNEKDLSEEFIEYLRTFKFTGDIYAITDGTVVFLGEPLITVKAPIIEAQIIETGLLLRKNFGMLITTKASRIVAASDGRDVIEFGTRRAQEKDAAVLGAKYAYLGGAIATACVQVQKEYGVPSVGTMAHSYIESFDSEYEAFLEYAKKYPNNCNLLVDTYDTLRSGVLNAIRVAHDYLIPNGYRLKGIRLDSGDLAYLSITARKLLDEAGLNDCKIVASNSLNEYVIEDLIRQGAKIDIFGVGENLITAASDPVLGGVYKFVAIERNNEIIPRIKLSDSIGKVTNPGYKKVYRFYDNETGYALGDVIALYDEVIPLDGYTLISTTEEWKRKDISNYSVRELQQPIFINGQLVYNKPTLEEIRQTVKQELNTIYPEIKRFKNPHEYYVDLSLSLLELKKSLITEHKEKVDKEERLLKESLGLNNEKN